MADTAPSPVPSAAPTEADADAALLARYAAGAQDAARLLAGRHAGRLLAHATRMLGGDVAEAEDAVQEAFLRLWRAAPGWRADGGARVGTWLFKVTGNLCIDRLRRRRTPVASLSDEGVAEPASQAPGAAAALMQAQRADALQRALNRLPERQRQAVVLRHLDGLSNPEIAAVMDTGVEAVESLLARARRALAADLVPKRDELGYADDRTDG